jgi:hypothetical protein
VNAETVRIASAVAREEHWRQSAHTTLPGTVMARFQ